MTSKKAVNWELIKAQVQDNVPISEIAAEHGVSRQSIYQRKEKEGWDQESDAPNWLQVADYVNRHMTVQRAASQQVIATILSEIGAGASLEFAAMSAGINQKTLHAWQNQVPEFKDAVQRARAYRIVRRQKNIDRAGDRGDWRASLEMLKRDPLTREAFRDDAADKSVHVHINVPRGEGVTIDGQTVESE